MAGKQSNQTRTVPMYSNTVRTNKYARMVGRERIPFYFSTASFDFKQEGMYRGPRQSKVLRRPEFVVVVGGTTPRGTTVRASSCSLRVRSPLRRLKFKGLVGLAAKDKTDGGSKAIRGARGARQIQSTMEEELKGRTGVEGRDGGWCMQYRGAMEFIKLGSAIPSSAFVYPQAPNVP